MAPAHSLGTSFDLWAGDDVLAFHDLGGGNVKIVLNGDSSVSFDHPLHLNINPMAVCIGEECVMWPEQKLPKPEKAVSDDEFLASVKEKLGADYDKLVRLLAKEAVVTNAPETQTGEQHSSHGKLSRVSLTF